MVVARLPYYEICFYTLVWTLSIVYSSYHVYLAGKLYDDSTVGDDFAWSWHGYKKDVADYEWTTWVPFILYKLLPWIVGHIFLTEIMRWISPKGVPALNTLITCLFLFINFGPLCLLFAVFQVIVYYLVLRLKSVILVWLFGLPFLLLSDFALQEMWDFVNKSEQQFVMLVVSTTWLYLRCTSFSLDLITSGNVNNASYHIFYDFLGYSFYFPTYFLGPFVLPANFIPYMYRPFQRWSKKRCGTFLFNLVRYFFWGAVAEASLYFLFIHALQYQITSVEKLGEWTLYGLGFLIGQFFYLKYIVVYGLAGTIVNFDGYVAPPPPKCTARIHLYTDMWRVFDVGFYQFMHKYIYTPLCAGQRSLTYRLMASAVCFGFVFIWHGVHVNIFIWSLLNFLIVSLITFVTRISKSDVYRNWAMRTLSEANSRRVAALISAPIFIMSPMSSFYFFSGTTIGNTFFIHLLFKGSWTGLSTLMFVSYCMCQVSIETKIWEEKIVQKIKTK